MILGRAVGPAGPARASDDYRETLCRPVRRLVLREPDERLAQLGLVLAEGDLLSQAITSHPPGGVSRHSTPNGRSATPPVATQTTSTPSGRSGTVGGGGSVAIASSASETLPRIHTNR